MLAPATVQEAVNLAYISLETDLAHRTIVILAGNGALGQMMEPVEMPPMRTLQHGQPGMGDHRHEQGTRRSVVTSLYLDADELGATQPAPASQAQGVAEVEQRWECYMTDDAGSLVVAFGTVARIARSAVRTAHAARFRGLFRPISLWPYPPPRFDQLVGQVSSVLVAEMNAGQMVEDVRAIVRGRAPVRFLGPDGRRDPDAGRDRTRVDAHENTTA